MRPNPLTDELTSEAKAELAVEFAQLAQRYPPVKLENLGGWIIARPIRYKPWQQNRRGW